MRKTKSQLIIPDHTLLDTYSGGQLLVLDSAGCLHCGEIHLAFIVNCCLDVRLVWNALRCGDQWVKDEELLYIVGLPLNRLYLDRGRLRVHSLHTQDKVVLFPAEKPWKKFSKEDISRFMPPPGPLSGYVSIIAKIFNTGPSGPGDTREFVPY